MLTSIILAAYFLTGIVLAYRIWSKYIPRLILETEEDDEADALSRELYAIVRLVGERGLLRILMVYMMLFWLPTIIVVEWRSRSK